MNQEIYSIKDTATQSFGQPMFLQTVLQALRLFINEVNREDANNPLYTNPDDFELYRIGQYNNDTGSLQPQEPELIKRAKDVTKRG